MFEEEFFKLADQNPEDGNVTLAEQEAAIEVL
jgi:hypothetical protein